MDIEIEKPIIISKEPRPTPSHNGKKIDRIIVSIHR
jgi:hypothetical protein